MAWSVGEKKSEVKKTATSKVTELRPLVEAPSPETAGQKKLKDETARERGRDLAGGMEMLELDFLLSIVEKTKGNDQNDVTMRKLDFNELLRREQLNEIDSNSLRVYAMDEGSLYGKDIQCEAMKELTIRTARKSKHSG
jgi:hypothetical protein